MDLREIKVRVDTEVVAEVDGRFLVAYRVDFRDWLFFIVEADE